MATGGEDAAASFQDTLFASGSFALPNVDEPAYRAMTFTLDGGQHELVTAALRAARRSGPAPAGGNGNAHALAIIAAAYLDG